MGWRQMEAEDRKAWADDLDASVGECERCGKENLSRHLVVDPFVKEGISDAPPDRMWWCYDCLDTRAGDV